MCQARDSFAKRIPKPAMTGNSSLFAACGLDRFASRFWRHNKRVTRKAAP